MRYWDKTAIELRLDTFTRYINNFKLEKIWLISTYKYKKDTLLTDKYTLEDFSASLNKLYDIVNKNNELIKSQHYVQVVENSIKESFQVKEYLPVFEVAKLAENAVLDIIINNLDDIQGAKADKLMDEYQRFFDIFTEAKVFFDKELKEKEAI